MYVDKIAAWKKIFINYENGSWNTKGLSSYTDATTLESINDKLKFISHELDNANEQPNVNLEQVMQENAEFILNVCT
jgi:hypothetical protein